jgi:hypothetical protein
MFKRILQIGLILAGITAMPSWAIIVSSSDIDHLITVSKMEANANPTTELGWVNTILNPDTTFTGKIEDVSMMPTNLANVYAFDLSPYSPGYFLVKNATGVALFENISDLMLGVIDVSALNTAFGALPCASATGNDKCKINLPSAIISHVTMFGGAANVPEPGVLGLLGIGLLGIVLGRRRMNAQI